MVIHTPLPDSSPVANTKSIFVEHDSGWTRDQNKNHTDKWSVIFTQMTELSTECPSVESILKTADGEKVDLVTWKLYRKLTSQLCYEYSFGLLDTWMIAQLRYSWAWVRVVIGIHKSVLFLEI